MHLRLRPRPPAERAARLADTLGPEDRAALLAELVRRDLGAAVEALAPALNRGPSAGAMPLDLPPQGEVRFEHLAGLVASTRLDHGVISMSIRQAAYVYGLARGMGARKAIEIGRYKGGSTLVLAAAMGPRARIWSLDIGEKEARLRATPGPSYDEQLAALLVRLGLRAELLVGDSRAMDVDTGPVDLVLIDGDHSYEGVRSDFERWGRRVRPGGAVLLDDAVDGGPLNPWHEPVGRFLAEVVAAGEFRLVRTVDRLAHLERAPRGA